MLGQRRESGRDTEADGAGPAEIKMAPAHPSVHVLHLGGPLPMLTSLGTYLRGITTLAQVKNSDHEKGPSDLKIFFWFWFVF